MKKKIRDLFQKFNKAAKDLRWKDGPFILKDTLSDMRDTKEIVAALTAAVVPGGIPVYMAYRIGKYLQKKNPPNPGPSIP